MGILIVVYVVIGLIYSNWKINNPNPALRPVWASDRSFPFIMRLLGFLVIAAIWPIIIKLETL